MKTREFVQETGELYWWNLGGWNNTQGAIQKGVGGAKEIVLAKPNSIATGTTYDIRIEVRGTQVTLFLNGTEWGSFTDDAVVNSPANAIHPRARVEASFGRGLIDYHGFERRLEYLGRVGDAVLAMGEEVVTPRNNAPNAGKTVRRRVTELWVPVGGGWKLRARQATIVDVR